MTEQQRQALHLADKFMLSICECESDPARLMRAAETWKALCRSIEERSVQETIA